MSDFLKQRLMTLATKKRTKIVLPEAEMDLRTLKAAALLKKEDFCDVTLVGDTKKINALAKANNVDIAGQEIVDPATDDRLLAIVTEYQQRRAKENLTDEQAAKVISNPLYYAAMLVSRGDADGMTAGAYNTTGNVLRASIKCIGTEKGIKTVSSFFLMTLPEGSEYGEHGTLVFADCGVNPDPTDVQLADICISTADTAAGLLGMEARVAMLSFSTKGSAKHESVDKVTSALAMVKERRPDIFIDGELQADAALVKKVGEFKAPGSPVAGKANILIFPNLDAGNISYKLTQRLANAEALGPILQGLAKSINDLSRGCSVEDIASVTVVTAAKANLLEGLK